MLQTDQIFTILADEKSVIDSFGVKRIGLFGSYVRSEQTSFSDIDILVEFAEGKKNFDNYMDLKFYLEDIFHQKVDLVIVDCVKPELASSIFGSVRYAQYQGLS